MEQTSAGELSEVGDLLASIRSIHRPLKLFLLCPLTSKHGSAKEAPQKKSRHCLYDGTMPEQFHEDCVLQSNFKEIHKWLIICQHPPLHLQLKFVLKRTAVTLMLCSKCTLFMLVDHACRIFLNWKRDQKQTEIPEMGALGPWFPVTSEKPEVLVTDLFYVYEHRASTFYCRRVLSI